MKKAFLLMGVIFLLTGCKNNIEVIGKNNLECHHPELLITKNGKNIYTYCFENAKVKENNKEIDLKDYIEDDDAINKIINTLNLEQILMDGGTKIYKGNITLIECNTTEGNKDIYIGNKDLEYKQNFCKNNNYTFIRTYTIIDIAEYKELQYEEGIPVTYGNSFQVTLSEFQKDTKTVIINNLWDITLEKNKTYEFEFMFNENDKEIKDEITYIFENANIIEIKETTKTGKEQIHEPIHE